MWDDVIKVNLSVPFFLAQEVARRMIKQRQRLPRI
jgi:NAD(P)-dependent dehydrogenase (short-subunit alcohol dehydrogenase family)